MITERDQPEGQDPQEPREGNLHDLTDDAYFAALAEMPPVLDAEGNEVTDLFADVVDAREEKAQIAQIQREKEAGQ